MLSFSNETSSHEKERRRQVREEDTFSPLQMGALWAPLVHVAVLCCPLFLGCL